MRWPYVSCKTLRKNETIIRHMWSDRVLQMVVTCHDENCL